MVRDLLCNPTHNSCYCYCCLFCCVLALKFDFATFCTYRFEETNLNAEQLEEDLDDLKTWLRETDNIISSKLRPADEEYLEDLLEKVKDREEEIQLQQNALDAMTSAQMEDDLGPVREQWTRVKAGLPTKRAAVEEALRTIHVFTGDLEALSAWVVSSREILEHKNTASPSPTSLDGNDSIVVDPSVSFHIHCAMYHLFLTCACPFHEEHARSVVRQAEKHQQPDRSV